MAINAICSNLRRLSLSMHGNFVRTCSTQTTNNVQSSNNILFPVTWTNEYKRYEADSEAYVKFAPKTLNIDFGLPRIGNNIRSIIDLPIIQTPCIEKPQTNILPFGELPLPNRSIDLPPNEDVIEKQAVRLIVIRRKKMAKHKRKKFRKRMTHVWIKLRQRRELLKEKTFQLEQIAKIHAAEAFNAKEYVNERIKILNSKQLPKIWKGELVPPDMMQKFLDEEEAKKEAKRQGPKLTL